MSKRKEAWNTKDNAKAYAIYADTFSLYKETSRDLVELVKIGPGMTIIDLAAGTGATTQAILDKVSNTSHIILIDQAEEMLKKAKQKFANNKNIEFIVSDAGNLDKVIQAPVESIICNSAFWQMVPKDIFKAVSRVLKKDGIFAFNLPNQYFDYEEFKTKPKKPLPYHVTDLVLWAKENKLNIISKSIKEYSRSIDDMIAFNQIPVMQRNFSNEEEKNNFITQLKSSKDKPRKREWVYFVFKKIKETAY